MKGERFDLVLAAAREGADWAWAELYDEFAPRVLGYLRARHAPEPEDLLGDVFLQIVRDLHRFSGGERQFLAWVFTIAHNRLLDDVRTRSRRPQVVKPLDELPPVPSGDVEDEALGSLTSERIRTVLSRLSDDQQAVLFLRLFADLTIPEIARVVGRSVGATKQLQRRGLIALRRALEEEGALSGADVALQGEAL